ncbi:universal stress protein [Acinetobacter bohemicus]|uniref:Universal stress protein n=1 Tax=Acinetobacter lwoffii TaxID=28090 RepID=A0A9D2ZZ31_ACILW|nr:MULTISPECIES: universal stress protein [Acinetobacter]MDM1780518.1 universal stress protein [Acinetobacter indicus]HJF27858.1 universal stress protein [Acinetobacter lwoffii]MCO8042515.1 universal stress protein [Acinetobacter sp. S4400-12]MCU7224287.1 universal stress protein [Acinetobacter bohemicus]QKQ69723.1 universal stress protein [Acinetobacter sp. 10FS3-1]
MAYQNILVPVDGSEISFSAVQHAAKIAKAFGSRLYLISLIAEDPFTEADFYYSSTIMKEYFAQAHANAKNSLKQAAALAEAEGIEADTRIVTGLVNAEHIVNTAQEVQADLIVMGSHGRKGFQKMILGSFAQDVLSATQVPVMVVKK